MKTIASIVILVALIVSLAYARHELSVGGQFDLESTLAFSIVFFPFGLVVLLPLVLPVILAGVLIVIVGSSMRWR